jgi:hypothetical protein
MYVNPEPYQLLLQHYIASRSVVVVIHTTNDDARTGRNALRDLFEVDSIRDGCSYVAVSEQPRYHFEV